MKRILSLAAGVLLLAQAALAVTPTDIEIHRILQSRLSGQTGIGIVVGVIDADGRRIVADGALDDKKPLNGDTLFEIGSKDERNFVIKAVDARITFGDDQLILHQNGADQPAKRITGDVPAPKGEKKSPSIRRSWSATLATTSRCRASSSPSPATAAICSRSSQHSRRPRSSPRTIATSF